MVVVRGLVILLVCILAGVCAAFPQDCPLPAVIKPIPREQNIFSDQQEADLSDIMAEANVVDFTVIKDDELNAHLQQLGEKLVQYLPPNQFRFRFLLMDLSEANAFSVPGGLVYVSRKMVALAHSDDELAGVLAHELGHIVTHQGAIYTTTMFRKVLGVTEVGDRADIAAKFHDMRDTWRRKPVKIPDREEEDQLVADQIALYAMARAGFAPQAWVDLLDRLQQTQGKTGTWFSDFFGSTKPEQRRLRASMKSMAAMPPACVEHSSSTTVEQFSRWQQEVIGHDVNARAESLSGVLFKQSLALPLRPDITNLRFSADGKFVLAQDSGGIEVLSRDPLAGLFFIDAIDANKAFFSPDSKSIVFYTPHLRVEVWDIASQKRTSVHEIVLRQTCLQSALSLDGNFLACFDRDFTLSLFEVSSSQALVTKKNFLIPNFYDIFSLIFLGAFIDEGVQLHFANLGFSPDGHYFLAGTRDYVFAFDLEQRREAGLPSSVRNLAHTSFAFIGPDRILAVNLASPKKSPVLKFPSGEKLQETALAPNLYLSSVAHGDFVIVSPLKDNPMGILDLRSGKVYTFQHDAADVYDGIVLYELLNGRVATADIAGRKDVASVQLNQARLGGIRAVTVSDDFSWLAVSTRTRGAVWDLAHNVRSSYVRGFTGAWFGPDHALYADFPKKDPQERAISRIDPLGEITPIYEIKDDKGYQIGPYFALRKSGEDEKPRQKGWIMDLRDYRTKQTVWSHNFSRDFPEMIWNTSLGTVLLESHLSSDFAQEELKKFPELKKKADADDYFFEVIDLQKSALAGKLLVSTNKSSFRIDAAGNDGDWVALETSDHRVITYALSSAQEKGHVFGMTPVLSSAAGLFAVSTAGGELNVYKLDGAQLHRHFRFPVAIAYKRFSPDGKRLFVLTRDQTAYVLDMSVAATTAKEVATPK